MSASLFKRGVSLTLSKVTNTYGAPNGIALTNVFFPTGRVTRSITSTTSDDTIITDLRVEFSITKTLRKEPNDCSITVYNLAESSRQALQVKPLQVRLDVGYDGNLERIFQGDLRWSESVKDGTEWVTRLALGDGERAQRYARVNRSFKAGVKVGQAVKEIADAMGMTLTTSARAADEFDKEFSAGLAIHGKAKDELERLLRPYGMRWSIQDGRLQILKDNEVRVDQDIPVSQDTGMIGTPEYGSPPEKGKKPVLTFRMLIYPGLTPGGVVDIRAKNLGTGPNRFKVQRVHHAGDTHGGDFVSTCEAVAA